MASEKPTESGPNESVSTAAEPLTREALNDFKESNVPLQYLIKELEELRSRNLALAKAGDFFKLQLFAEGAVCMLALEHFLRAILGDRATEDHTLRNLLDMATSKKNGGPLLVLPWDTQPNGCKQITAVRNTTMHTNYVQAARDAGCSSVADYFRDVYPSEIENTYQVLDNLMKQIDERTGRRREPVKPGETNA